MNNVNKIIILTISLSCFSTFALDKTPDSECLKLKAWLVGDLATDRQKIEEERREIQHFVDDLVRDIQCSLNIFQEYAEEEYSILTALVGSAAKTDDLRSIRPTTPLGLGRNMLYSSWLIRKTICHKDALYKFFVSYKIMERGMDKAFDKLKEKGIPAHYLEQMVTLIEELGFNESNAREFSLEKASPEEYMNLENCYNNLPILPDEEINETLNNYLIDYSNLKDTIEPTIKTIKKSLKNIVNTKIIQNFELEHSFPDFDYEKFGGIKNRLWSFTKELQTSLKEDNTHIRDLCGWHATIVVFEVFSKPIDLDPSRYPIFFAEPEQGLNPKAPRCSALQIKWLKKFRRFGALGTHLAQFAGGTFHKKPNFQVAHDEIIRNLELGKPVIIFLGIGHWISLVQYKDGYFFAFDNAKPRIYRADALESQMDIRNAAYQFLSDLTSAQVLASIILAPIAGYEWIKSWFHPNDGLDTCVDAINELLAVDPKTDNFSNFNYITF